MSELMPLLRRLAGHAAVAAFYAVAPSTVPPWRLDPGRPPAVVLAVGEPMSSVAGRRGGASRARR